MAGIIGTIVSGGKSLINTGNKIDNTVRMASGKPKRSWKPSFGKSKSRFKKKV